MFSQKQVGPHQGTSGRGARVLKRARTYLGVIFAIFARDVRRVLRNPIAIVVVLGMAAIPSAYAWYVVAANWDPYQNTASMKVAVANEDTGFESAEVGSLDVGAQVVAELKDNHELGWEFTDKESAVNGVYEGRYWAALVIPPNFSRDFASVLSGDFTQPTLDYYVNEKPSSIAPKVTDAGAKAVEKAINENFVKTVVEKVVGTTQDAGVYAEDKADDATGSLTAGLRSAHTTVGQARTAIDGLQDTVNSTRSAVGEADNTLASLQEKVPHLEQAVEQSQTLLEQARSAANTYGSSLAQQATDAALKLGSAAAQTQQALGSTAGAVDRARADTAAALDEAQALLTANQQLISDLKAQAAASPDATITQALADAQQANAKLSATVSALDQANDALATTADALGTAASAVDKAAQDGASTIQQTAATFQSAILPSLTASLDDLTDACGTLKGALSGLTPTFAEARAVLGELSTTLESSASSLDATSASLATMEGNLARALSDLEALQNSATVKELADYLKADPNEVGAFMAAPVTLDTQLVYPVKNYGSGVAPFFTNLALWVAGFVLMAIVKMRVDPAGLPQFTATQAYFGRWLFYVVIGLIQGFICCAGDVLMGIQCESPAAFIGAGLLTVFVDVNLMYALAYAFRHIGKALAVILLIMQIPGSSGMFPVEMMPAFFQAIHPLLPFTYSIDAMREAIGGFYGLNYLKDMLCLGLVFVPLGFLIGLGVGRCDFNLTLMFDEKLRATDLLLAEPVTSSAAANAAKNPVRYRVRTLMRALLDTDAFRAKLIARAERFRRIYPRLRRVGWIALVAQPIATFAVMVIVHADVDTRVEMLVALVAGIIAVDVYLIVISYLDTNLAHQMALAHLSPTDLHTRAVAQIAAPSTRGQKEDAAAEPNRTVPSSGSGSPGGDDA